ncbi:hypothetical protein PUNSTDRAFT_90226 [Punctularia strigosozonata HHB-11173 SS5]|uniref:uncharacterized protein n=1 Tax=Punctularia strigosozonata (strain HHB-11173) TaxID=741275 RepID=UPI0004417162|nr:uncharacterized protein PUNSTDRAFT_90226 [Punctularia strigosozonata HHB-11173 SS5]EIN06571.1 hypothetical protein PUNSTDRAFT_90226 [Punctularia strigosozonata HHB-11173 SS5]
MSGNGGRFSPYKQALAALAARTGTPVSSLIVSFGILHELTAILPIAGFFYGARAFGVGDRLADPLRRLESEAGHARDAQISGGTEVKGAEVAVGDWATEKTREWVHDGGMWAERVGRRYGLFGFEKGSKPGEGPSLAQVGPKIAGDVANVVIAYAATKALLPVRIGLSLYLTPAFARRIVDPIRSQLMSPFRRKQ